MLQHRFGKLFENDSMCKMEHEVDVSCIELAVFCSHKVGKSLHRPSLDLAVDV
jgi:hypothetical protein